MPIDPEDIEIAQGSADEIKVLDSLIHIHVTNEDGVEEVIEDITTARKGSSLTNISHISNHTSPNHSVKDNANPWHKHSKVIFLLLTWFCSMAFMTTESEKKIHHKLLSINEFESKSKWHEYDRVV